MTDAILSRLASTAKFPLVQSVVLVAGCFFCLLTGLQPRSKTSTVICSMQRQRAPESPRLDCVTYCDKMRPGSSVVELRWLVTRESTNDKRFWDLMETQSLEVTTYKNGFETGRYLNLRFSAPQHLFMALENQHQLTERLTGLTGLRISTVQRSKSKEAENLHLHNSLEDQGEWVTVQVEGVDAGLTYFWRVHPDLPNSTVRTSSCVATVCPLDYIHKPN